MKEQQDTSLISRIRGRKRINSTRGFSDFQHVHGAHMYTHTHNTYTPTITIIFFVKESFSFLPFEAELATEYDLASGMLENCEATM